MRLVVAQQLALVAVQRPVEHGRVVAGDVAEARLRQHVVAALHLLHGPRQGIRRLARLGDHRCQQVRQAVVLPELDPLGVDEDHPHLIGRGPHEQRRDDRVDARRLARAGRSRNEHVGHRGQVEHDLAARDVLAHRHFERVHGVGCGLGGQDVAERDQVTVGIGNLDADRRPAGDRREDPDIGGGHGVGDVLVERRDARHLHARSQLQLVTRDGGSWLPAGDLGLHAVTGQCGHQCCSARRQLRPVELLGAAAFQHRLLRQLPARTLASRSRPLACCACRRHRCRDGIAAG